MRCASNASSSSTASISVRLHKGREEELRCFAAAFIVISMWAWQALTIWPLIHQHVAISTAKVSRRPRQGKALTGLLVVTAGGHRPECGHKTIK